MRALDPTFEQRAAQLFASDTALQREFGNVRVMLALAANDAPFLAELEQRLGIRNGQSPAASDSGTAPSMQQLAAVLGCRADTLTDPRAQAVLRQHGLLDASGHVVGSVMLECRTENRRMRILSEIGAAVHLQPVQQEQGKDDQAEQRRVADHAEDLRRLQLQREIDERGQRQQKREVPPRTARTVAASPGTFHAFAEQHGLGRHLTFGGGFVTDEHGRHVELPRAEVEHFARSAVRGGKIEVARA